MISMQSNVKRSSEQILLTNNTRDSLKSLHFQHIFNKHFVYKMYLLLKTFLCVFNDRINLRQNKSVFRVIYTCGVVVYGIIPYVIFVIGIIRFQSFFHGPTSDRETSSCPPPDRPDRPDLVCLLSMKLIVLTTLGTIVYAFNSIWIFHMYLSSSQVPTYLSTTGTSPTPTPDWRP